MTDIPATQPQLQHVREAIATQQAWFNSANDDPTLAITMVQKLVRERGASALADLVAGYMVLCGQLVVETAQRQKVTADEVLRILSTHFASPASDGGAQG